MSKQARPRDHGAVRVMERDLREHPRYRDALLVDAILVNQAAFAQPYPILELALYDTEGAVVAGRRFEPREYLAGPWTPTASCPPGSRSMWSWNCGRASFEFRFFVA